jgi:hypothetical protein
MPHRPPNIRHVPEPALGLDPRLAAAGPRAAGRAADGGARPRGAAPDGAEAGVRRVPAHARAVPHGPHALGAVPSEGQALYGRGAEDGEVPLRAEETVRHLLCAPAWLFY